MNRLFFVLIFIFSIKLNAQEFSNIGIDNNSILNLDEAQFLQKSITIKNRDSINFKDKKVVFITGPTGKTFLSKIEYFKTIKHVYNTNGEINSFVVKLNDKERLESGGFDLIIGCYVKIFTDVSKRKVLKKLKR